MAIDPELRPVNNKERQFINLIAYQGVDRLEAYSLAYDAQITEENEKSLKQKASTIFYRPHVFNYYEAIMEEIREREVKKGVWTKEVATDKLVRLVEQAEKEIYGDPAKGVNEKPVTLSRLNAIILPIKELNLMNGYNQTNMNIDGTVVQICGENELKD